MINVVTLEGKLVRFNVRNAGSAQVADFDLSVTKRWGDGDDKMHTSFVNCEAWNLPEAVTSSLEAAVEQNDLWLLVTGELQQDRWEDREGKKRNKLKVRVSSLGKSEKNFRQFRNFSQESKDQDSKTTVDKPVSTSVKSDLPF